MKKLIRTLVFSTLVFTGSGFLQPQVALSQSPVMMAEEDKWLGVFEQSYGTEGLYIVEVHPEDKGGISRLNLQKLNIASREFIGKFPTKVVTDEALKKAGLYPDVEKEAEDEVYTWSPSTELFESSLNEHHQSPFGALVLLEGNEQIRRRILHPDSYTRKRWGKIYNDPNAPEYLKQEITLREFLLEHFHFEGTEQADQIQENLAKLDEAIRLYVLSAEKEEGDKVTWAELDESGFSSLVGSFPKGARVDLQPVGTRCSAVWRGVAITSDPQSVLDLRKKRAEQLFEKHPDFPPAMILMARFKEPTEGLNLVNKAIVLWPDVPGVRLERLTQLARLGRFNHWTQDLDYIVDHFPTAPLLIEIQLLGESSGLAENEEVNAEIAMVLADVRPDLLTHQLYAIKVLEKSGKHQEARSLYERLLRGNPAWKEVLDKPETEK